MFNIDNKSQIIRMTKGDTCSTVLFIDQGDSWNPVRYNLSEHPNTNIYLSITEPNQTFECGLIKKMYTSDNWELNENGDLIISLESADTVDLIPGKYYYQIKVQRPDKVDTVIQKTEFWIEE